MRRLPLPGALAAWLFATAILSSCGIRLPIHPQDVQRVPVRSEARIRKVPQDPDLLVWLIADDFHTGMVFPYDWLLESGFIPPAGFGNPKYVAMSWGNADAYSRQGLETPLKWCEVLFTPTPSVMELIPVNWNVAEVCPHQRIWRRLTPRDRGPRLADFLNQCSVKGVDARPIVVRPSSWGNGVQLKGQYRYFIPRVCNIWTAQAIECLGGRFHPWFALTADGVARQAVKPPNNFEEIWEGWAKETTAAPDVDATQNPPGL